MTSEKSREVIEDENAIGFKLLGYTVVFSCKGIEVDSTTIYNLLEPLDWHDFLPVVRPHTRLRRAIMRWMKDQIASDSSSFGLEERDERRMLREISKGSSGDIIAYAIVHEKSDLDHWGLNYLTGVRIFLTQSSDNILVDRQGSYDQALHDSFLPYWTRYKDVYITGDIGRLVPRVIATLQSAAMKDGGGTYFVPYEQRGALQQLKDIIEVHLPAAPDEEHAASLTAIPVIDRPGTKKNMATLAFKAMEAEVEAMQKDLERFVEELKTRVKDRKTGEARTNADGTVKYMKVREQTIKDRIDAYGKTRAKVLVFKEKLGLQEEALLAKLEQLTLAAKAVKVTGAEVMSSNGVEEEQSQEKTQETAGVTLGIK